MFNTIVNKETNYPDTINIHHHKAPTDESIRLLNEFQEKAFSNIVNHIKVETNLVKGEVILYNDSFSRSKS